MKIKAKNLKDVDKERDLHWAAFLHRVVNATDKKGNYVYKTFPDFFDEKKVLSQLDEEKQHKAKTDKKRMADIAMRINQRKGE